jgi:uncharacterized caspase-like protein
MSQRSPASREAPRSRSAEIGSVMKRVRADVVQATRGKQIPWDHSSLIGDVVLAQ